MSHAIRCAMRLLLLALTVVECVGCGDANAPASATESESPLRNGARILMLVGGEVPESHAYAQSALQVLRAQHVTVDVMPLEAPLTTQVLRRYAGFVVSDAVAYESMPSRATLDARCRTSGAGILFLYVAASRSLASGRVTASPRGDLLNEEVPSSNVLRLLRPTATSYGALPGWSTRLTGSGSGMRAIAKAPDGTATLLLDEGAPDGVRRAYWGIDYTRHWLHDLLLLDLVSHLSRPSIAFSRERWFGIDIDDVFQPSWDDDPTNRTVKVQADDVAEILASQGRIASAIGGPFRYTLGFNSGFYGLQVGDSSFDDAAGDHAFVAHRAELRWFDHLPGHEVVVDHTEAELTALMRESHAWAVANNVLPYMTRYAVTPAHWGMDPAHEPLFDAWKSVWNIGYSAAPSTRGGQIHRGVKIADRKDCSEACYSNRYSLAQVPLATQDAVVRESLARHTTDNAVLLFMSHQSNYARDRIAISQFERWIAFVKLHTTLELHSASDDVLVEKFFASR